MHLRLLKALTLPPSAAPTFEAEYQTILTYATSKGWALPSAPHQALQNARVLALKTSGIWALLDGWFEFENDGTSDINYSCINWKNPDDATNAVRVNSPVWSVNGFKGDLISAYVDLSFNPITAVSPKFTQDNASIFADVHTAGSIGLSRIFGQLTGTMIDGRSTSSVVNRLNASVNTAAATDFTGTGLKHYSRQSATNVKSYNNLTETATTTASSAAPNSSNICALRSVSSYGDGLISVIGFGADISALNGSLKTILDAY